MAQLSVTKFIAMVALIVVTAIVAAEFELLFNKPASAVQVYNILLVLLSTRGQTNLPLALRGIN